MLVCFNVATRDRMAVLIVTTCARIPGMRQYDRCRDDVLHATLIVWSKMLAFFASRGFTQVGTARCRGLDFFAENTRLQAN